MSVGPGRLAAACFQIRIFIMFHDMFHDCTHSSFFGSRRANRIFRTPVSMFGIAPAFLFMVVQGASYYRLPKVLQWITGNIGLHHLHHLRPRIPNYHLQSGHDATPAFQRITPLTLGTSFRSAFLNLWDETNQRLASFSALRTLSRSPGAGAVSGPQPLFFIGAHLRER